MTLRDTTELSKGTHESSVDVFVRVHMLQVCVHVKHVVVVLVAVLPIRVVNRPIF